MGGVRGWGGQVDTDTADSDRVIVSALHRVPSVSWHWIAIQSAVQQVDMAWTSPTTPAQYY